MKQPWFKFYSADWRSDVTLGTCSLAARGLWMEMLCVMSEAEPRGSLTKNGRPFTEAQVAALARCSVKEAHNLLTELEKEGVFSRDEDGTIYSRRMRRDVAKALKDKENGRAGGNPQLLVKDKGGVNPEDKAKKLEARSQKPEKESSLRSDNAQRILTAVLSDETAKDLIAHRRAKKSPMTDGAAKQLVQQFRDFGDAELAARTMMARGWTGFKPEWMANDARDGPSNWGSRGGGFAEIARMDQPGWSNGHEDGFNAAHPAAPGAADADAGSGHTSRRLHVEDRSDRRPYLDIEPIDSDRR